MAREQVLGTDTAFSSAGPRFCSRDDEGDGCHFAVIVAKHVKAPEKAAVPLSCSWNLAAFSHLAVSRCAACCRASYMCSSSSKERELKDLACESDSVSRNLNRLDSLEKVTCQATCAVDDRGTQSRNSKAVTK